MSIDIIEWEWEEGVWQQKNCVQKGESIRRKIIKLPNYSSFRMRLPFVTVGDWVEICVWVCTPAPNHSIFTNCFHIHTWCHDIKRFLFHFTSFFRRLTFLGLSIRFVLFHFHLVSSRIFHFSIHYTSMFYISIQRHKKLFTKLSKMWENKKITHFSIKLDME